MDSNIVLLTEDKSKFKDFLLNIRAFNRCNTVSDISVRNIRKACFNFFDILLISYDEYDEKEILKIIDYVKNSSLDTQIILLTSNADNIVVNDFQNRNIFDFVDLNRNFYEANIKILNCLKYKQLKEYVNILSKFTHISGFKNSKSGLYTHKALKEVFDYLVDNPKFKNGCYVILALDEKIKTKICVNRLANNLKKNLRMTDIVAQGLGKFYLLLPDTNISEAKIVVDKISSLMGSDIKIHAGISQVSMKTFSELEKSANDGFKSAVINDELYVSLDENYFEDENLLGITKNDKHYKLFKKVYEHKLSSIIEPAFYAFERDISVKSGVFVNQYVNSVESVFNLKSNTHNSELILRHDGFAKLNIKIMHKGLETSENSEFVVDLNELNKKNLQRILNCFYKEFNTGNNN